MAKKLRKFTAIDAEGFTPQAKRVGEDKTGPDPKGGEQAKRVNVYLYPRDEKKIKEIQDQLKRLHGRVTVSQLFRFALNTANFDNYRDGF